MYDACVPLVCLALVLTTRKHTEHSTDAVVTFLAPTGLGGGGDLW